MFKVEAVMSSQRAKGPATVMAIGTANPPECFEQSKFTDFYFRVTDSEHRIELKEKLKRICDKSAIRKRYMHLTEDMLERNPGICKSGAASLNARQDIVVVEVPKLGTEAAEKAIEEWGRPKSEITHLIFSTSSGIDMPGADYQLTKLLGLSLSVKRYMFYNHGCFAGGTGLRLAKDLAENNKGARVLVVCVEMMAAFFQGPSDTNHDTLVVVSLFGDGAGAVIVGSDPITGVEKPIFEIVTGTQTLIPDSRWAIRGALRESGLNVHLHKDVPTLISDNIKKILGEAFKPLGSIPDWNSLFWAVHSGGRAILDKLEHELGLHPIKLGSSRHVLGEYGNLACACTFFVLDDLRKKFAEEKHTTGGGSAPEWGVLVSFGPGLTVEAVVLHNACP